MKGYGRNAALVREKPLRAQSLVRLTRIWGLIGCGAVVSVTTPMVGGVIVVAGVGLLVAEYRLRR